jgi:hypothetical protein
MRRVFGVKELLRSTMTTVSSTRAITMKCAFQTMAYSLYLAPEAPGSEAEEGWIIGPTGDLILWIPRELRYKLAPPTTIYIGYRESIHLDLSQFVHGESWAQCYTSGTMPPGLDREALVEMRHPVSL